MSDAPSGISRHEVEAYIVDRALRDDVYRQRVKQDPRAALAEAVAALTGEDYELPAEVSVEVVEEGPRTIYLVLPPATPAEGDLSDADLESVAGGVTMVQRRSLTWVWSLGSYTSVG